MLKDFRKKHNLTQAKFAEKVGVARTTYQAWELGKNKPSEENEEKLKSAIHMVEAYNMACLYYKALSRQNSKPRFTWKRKLLKLIVALLIIIILTVLY